MFCLCQIPEGQGLDELQSSDAFKHVVKIITALSTQDERITEELKYRQNQEKAKASQLIKVDNEISSLLNLDFNVIEHSVQLAIWQRVGLFNWQPYENAALIREKFRIKDIQRMARVG